MQRGAAHADAGCGADATEPAAAASAPPPRPLPASIGATAAPAAPAAGAQRPLARNRDLGRDGVEVEHLADERAQGDDELGGLDAAPGDHVVGGARRQAHLLFGTEQDHVGQRGLHGIAHAASALGAGRVGGGPVSAEGRRRIASAAHRSPLGLRLPPRRRSRRCRGSTADRR